MRGWSKREPARLWQNAPRDANIGVRCGGVNNFAVLDADDKNKPGTAANAERWIAGLGIDQVPTVQTASGVGRHYYFSLDGSLPGEYSVLKPEFGGGEFRHGSGAYVVSVPSVVDGACYELISGSFEWLPEITLADILPIISRDMTQATTPKFEPTISRKAWALLNGASSGYASRSETEQALLLSLVNTGHDFDSVLSLFQKHPCAGKFTELRAANQKNAIRWLKHSYDEAVWYAQHESPTRRALLELQTWAQSTAWTGRTGAYDRAVFLAHVTKAYQAGQYSYHLSCREIAELSGTTAMTASRANKRLIDAGLVSIQRFTSSDCSNMYNLNGHNVTYPKYFNVRICNSLSSVVSHDLFRRSGGLGKSCGEVFAALQVEPATVKELAERTGRHAKTIKRCLLKMQRITNSITGELVSLVEQDGDVWRVCDDGNLEHAARVLGAAGAGERQRMKHLQERHAHRRLLQSYKNSKLEVT